MLSEPALRCDCQGEDKEASCQPKQYCVSPVRDDAVPVGRGADQCRGNQLGVNPQCVAFTVIAEVVHVPPCRAIGYQPADPVPKISRDVQQTARTEDNKSHIVAHTCQAFLPGFADFGEPVKPGTSFVDRAFFTS